MRWIGGKTVWMRALTVALLVIAAGVVAFGAVYAWIAVSDKIADAQYEARAAPLRAAKEWTPAGLPGGGGEVSLSTAFRDYKLLYQLKLDGYPERIAMAVDEATRPDQLFEIRYDRDKPAFTIRLCDADGFELAQIHVPLNRMSIVVDDSGNRVGLYGAGSESIGLEDYENASSWSIQVRYPN